MKQETIDAIKALEHVESVNEWIGGEHHRLYINIASQNRFANASKLFIDLQTGKVVDKLQKGQSGAKSFRWSQEVTAAVKEIIEAAAADETDEPTTTTTVDEAADTVKAMIAAPVIQDLSIRIDPATDDWCVVDEQALITMMGDLDAPGVTLHRALSEEDAERWIARYNRRTEVRNPRMRETIKTALGIIENMLPLLEEEELSEALHRLLLLMDGIPVGDIEHLWDQWERDISS